MMNGGRPQSRKGRGMRGGGIKPSSPRALAVSYEPRHPRDAPVETAPAPGESMMTSARHHALQIRGNLEGSYPDVYPPEALAALAVLAPLNEPRRALMSARIQRRAARARGEQRIAFLDP